jgi:NAD(P)H dehydrogenase (quinone)
LRTTGVHVTILRSTYFQDNVAGAVAPAMHSGIYPHFFPSDDAAFPMIATKDSGTFAAQALLEPSGRTETVLLLGPAYSARDIAAKLGAALGKPLTIVAVPPAARLAALMDAGAPQQLAEAVVEMMDAFAAGRIVLTADQQLAGSTVIDDVIRQVVRAKVADC